MDMVGSRQPIDGFWFCAFAVRDLNPDCRTLSVSVCGVRQDDGCPGVQRLSSLPGCKDPGGATWLFVINMHRRIKSR